MNSVKKGFTLAEMLIALVLVGVIAAMVIPKLLTSTGTKTRDAKLKTTASTVEQVLGQMDPSLPSTTNTWALYFAGALNGSTITPLATSGCGAAAGTTNTTVNGYRLKDNTVVVFTTTSTFPPTSGTVGICIDPMNQAGGTGVAKGTGYVGTFDMATGKANWGATPATTVMAAAPSGATHATVSSIAGIGLN